MTSFIITNMSYYNYKCDKLNQYLSKMSSYDCEHDKFLPALSNIYMFSLLNHLTKTYTSLSFNVLFSQFLSGY